MRLDGPPGKVIPEAAAVRAVDVLVVGSHGRTGVSRVLLGSVAEKILRASPVPVLVARGPAESPFGRILVATDFGEPAERALRLALELAAPGATVDVVHFVSIVPLVAVPARALLSTEMERLTARALPIGRQLLARHRRDDVVVDFASEIGDPRLGALERIRLRGYDLVAVGSHGRSRVTRALLGSVSEGIVRHAPCSVLVTR
jgi:nucleotide-binding universal stress UspA family protein